MHVAAGLLGWLVPDTDVMVKATALEEDEDVYRELPIELQDPFAVLDRDRQKFPAAPMHCCDGRETVEGAPLNLLAEKIINAK